MATKSQVKADKDTEEDFVILESFKNMADSSSSNASTIPEKQTFESLEKPLASLEKSSGSLGDSKTSESSVYLEELSINEPSISDSFSSLGDSSINEKPYYESSRFIQKQLEKERKLGVLGEGNGEEKGDDLCSEKGAATHMVVNLGEGGGLGVRPGDDVEIKSGGSLEKMSNEEGSSRGGVKIGKGQLPGNSECGKGRDGEMDCGLVRSGGIGVEVGAGKGESSWICVENKSLIAKGEDSGVGDEISAAEQSIQKQQGVVVSPVDASVDEDKTGEQGIESPVDKESGRDLKLVGSGLERKEQSNGESSVAIINVAAGDVKVESEINVEDTHKISHVEDIPSEEQNAGERDCESSRYGFASQCLVNMKDETPVENSSDENIHHRVGSVPSGPDSRLVEHDTPSLPEQIEQNSKQESGYYNEPNDITCSSRLNDSLHTRSEDEGTNVPHQTSQDSVCSQTQQSVKNESANKDSINKPDNGVGVCSSSFDRTQPNQPEDNATILQHTDSNDLGQQALNNHLNEPEDQRPPEREQPIVHNQRCPGCYWLILSVVFGLLAIVLMFVPAEIWHGNVITIPKPTVEINAKTHLPPTSTSWDLKAKCRVYNASYAIKHCQWKQIHPLPTSPENTVLPRGIKDCLPPTSSHPPTQDVDATLYDLKVPSDLGTYTFELACGHEAENPATKRVEIWVNELNPPIITVTNPDVTICISTGQAKLEVLCRAVQGKIVLRKWVYIDGPPEVVTVTPDKDGLLELTTPGIYKFKYRCTDNFGGTALSPFITVHAKPAYVLGIDLGTSTTCMAIIKEDGTRQDIAIHEDDSDGDPCMPSVVAFSRNGELLIGEKALRQAVVNPDATIYEVKRLMGRSYYDDAEHKFVYRVRPTLKSHTLKGIRAAIEIPCGKSRSKLVQPELVSALILRYVADRAQKYLGVSVKDVVISVPAQFDDAQRKATFDAGVIAGLNPIKIVNEPTVAAFAANSLTEKVLADSNKIDDAEADQKFRTIWAVVADIGGGTTDYALMQIQGSYYKVITTDGDKTLGGRDIDIRLTEVLTQILQDKYLGFDLTSSVFQQKLRMECESAKIVLSEKEQYSLTVEYHDEDENTESMPLEYLLTRDEFELYVSPILDAMVKPLDSLLTRAGGRLTETLGQGIKRENIEDLYLVGGTSHIPKLKQLLMNYFSNAKNVLHKDPVQLVSRGAAAFGAALTGLVQLGKMPRIDAVPLPISIAVDMDDMHEIFERNRLYPCIEKRDTLTTYTNNQNAIVIKVYEGEGRKADECHFLGEFELSGIPPLPKNVPKIQATFKIDSNGILSVKASYGDVVKGGMKLDVYSKSGGMVGKARDKMALTLRKLMRPSLKGEAKCDALEDATPMAVIPVKPRKSNVLKLYVDSEFDSVPIVDKKDPNAMIPALVMVTVKGLVTDTLAKEADLDIVMVVDLSGSMAGTPIETMKNFMLRLIDRLKENHRLGIVTYATNVDRVLELVSCTAQNKEKAKDIVNNFWTLGATNLYGGLLTGLHMAYHGERRSRVLLFTDGYANDGRWITKEDIVREIVRETTAMSSVTQAQVMLSTFGYLGEHDHNLLQQLATNVGVGTYNFLNENSALVPVFAKVLGDAIYTVAENIELSVTPLEDIQIVEAVTEFVSRKESEKMIFKIPSTADQQSRHILLQLAVPPTRKPAIYAGLFRVELKYKNTLTELEEGSEEYLFVARTEKLDVESRSQDVDEQLNRVFVARQIQLSLNALKSDADRAKSAQFVKEAYDKIQNSESKGHTLSVCLSEDLKRLIKEVAEGDLNTTKKLLQDSLTSHWQEKGGHASCYVTRKEDKLITIFTNETNVN